MGSVVIFISYDSKNFLYIQVSTFNALFYEFIPYTLRRHIFKESMFSSVYSNYFWGKRMKSENKDFPIVDFNYGLES
jgi:hypothetical protein